MTRRVRIAVFLPALAGFGALIVWAYTGLPAFGNYQGPYGFVLERIATPLRHMDNVVNATTYDIRGFDTMGEEFILFAAVIGVVLLLRGSSDEDDEEPEDRIGSDLVRVCGTLAIGAALLVGLWLVAFGFVTPGGGFQGGVAIASAALLLYLAAGHREWSGFGNEHLLDPLDALGAGGFVVLGLAPVFGSLPFLANFLGGGITGTVWSAGSAGFVNWAAGIEVAAAILVLYTQYIQQYVAPLARGKQ